MNTYLYIAIMALTTYAIRVLPLTLIRKPIKSRFLRSFLYYVPYVTLAVMTFPAITTATGSPVAGACAMAAGIVGAGRKDVFHDALSRRARHPARHRAGVGPRRSGNAAKILRLHSLQHQG